MMRADYKYPAQKPRRSFHLSVDESHEVFVEEYGTTRGIPLVELHGGPGVGSIAEYHRLFNPDRYRIIMCDQRGAGKSRPLGELSNNTLWHLVSDLEALREEMQIERWVVTGWSWGTTLALAYAETHPERVMALVLRGAWTARPHEAEWFGQGIRNFFPDVFEQMETDLKGIPDEDKLQALGNITSNASLPEDVRERAARDAGRYELTACYLEASQAQIQSDLSMGPQLPIAQIGAHYSEHKWFMEEDQLWRDLDRITDIRCVFIHGRYDVVSLPRTSYELHKALPKSELLLVPRSGHLSNEPLMIQAITQAMDELASELA